MALKQNIQEDVASLFDPCGDITNRIPNYTFRWQQQAMAVAVVSAITTRHNLIVEAGTGTGKTIAYLVAVLLAKGKTIISTGTRTLQDQLFEKDLPTAVALVGANARVALLKGRRNYLCPERLDKHLKVGDRNPAGTRYEQLVRVRQWSSHTRTGDLTELLDEESDGALIPMITSTALNCLGRSCPHIDVCPLYAARARAGEADIVVVNHHLLFADLALQDDNISAILPVADQIIVDEAHGVAEVARQFSGLRMGSNHLSELCRDIRRELAILGNDDPLLLEYTRSVENKLARLFAAFKALPDTKRIGVVLDSAAVCRAVSALDLALGGLIRTLQGASQRGRTLAQCYQRANVLADRFALLTEGANDETGDDAHWLELGERGFSLHRAPVSIASEFGARVESGAATWVFTSATLSVGESFAYTRALLGLPLIKTLRFESPFDYARQVSGFIPPIIDKPGSDAHTHALMDAVIELLRVVPGRTFLLFTSYRALGIAAARLAVLNDIRAVVQGSLPRRQVLEKFLETERCVLLATMSFWEGVDVRGSDLNCLVIDKLPFASPEEPLVRAMVQAIERSGGNGFLDSLVPEAAIALRQGFGRLIRDGDDRGLFILGDSRMLTHAYGQLFFESLPDITWLESARDARDYLMQLK